MTKKTFTESKEIDVYLQKLTQEITVELEHLRFNTSIARIMTYYNFLVKKESDGTTVTKGEVLNLIKILAPFVPFLGEELWECMGQKYSVHQEKWPQIEKEQLEGKFISTIAIQINGKTRDTIQTQNSKLKTKNEIEEMARNKDKIQKYLEGKTVKKVIYVQNKVINFVV